jgi:Papain-like cysteine protease AvrRpt2
MPPRVVTVHLHSQKGSYTPPHCDILPDSAVLPVTRIAQERTEICWAASAQMAMRAFNVDVSQSAQLTHRMPACAPETCPESAQLASGNCNSGGWPDFRAFGFTARQVHGALSLDELKQEIGCRHSPVLFSWADELGAPILSGHMMVAYGYENDTIFIRDPLPTCDLSPGGAVGDFADFEGITYDEYLNGRNSNNGGGHWDDFYAIQPKGVR